MGLFNEYVHNNYGVAWDYIEDRKKEEAQQKEKAVEHKHPAKTGPNNWKIGGRYYLPGGDTPFTLLGMYQDGVNNYQIVQQYDNLKHNTERSRTTHLHKAVTTDYNDTNWTDKGTDDMNTLYEFTHNDKQLFGTKIAVNSSGLWVMEVKGTGEVLTVDKDKVEEVIPHSIGVKFFSNSQVYHYLAPKDKFEKGFYLLTNQNAPALVEVVDLNTKSKKATTDFLPSLKFVTEVVDNSK